MGTGSVTVNCREQGNALLKERCQFVFTVTADSLTPIVAAVEKILVGRDYSIHASRNPRDGFTESAEDLSDAVARLEHGTFSTVIVRPKAAPVEFSLIHHPSTSEGLFSLYSATFEYTARRWSTMWNLLLSCAGLRVVSLGMEEGVELTDDVLTPASFPWNKWPLIIAAVRSDRPHADWVIGEGPEMKGPVRSDGGDAFRSV
jgi:hypothetical protein